MIFFIFWVRCIDGRVNNGNLVLVIFVKFVYEFFFFGVVLGIMVVFKVMVFFYVVDIGYIYMLV